MEVFTLNGCLLNDNRHIRSHILNRINFFPVELLIDSVNVTIVKNYNDSIKVLCSNTKIRQFIFNLLLKG